MIAYLSCPCLDLWSLMCKIYIHTLKFDDRSYVMGITRFWIYWFLLFQMMILSVSNEIQCSHYCLYKTTSSPRWETGWQRLPVIIHYESLICSIKAWLSLANVWRVWDVLSNEQCVVCSVQQCNQVIISLSDLCYQLQAADLLHGKAHQLQWTQSGIYFRFYKT